ncbi:hypothetical protein RB595_008830 [Gaeumannomyces hyphopodioides]
MPPCALSCLIWAAPQAGCALSNTTCLCTSPMVQKLVEPCIRGNCTVRQQLMAANSTTVTCNRPRTDEAEFIRLSMIPLYVLPSIFLAARLAVKLILPERESGGWGVDDWSVVAAYLFNIAFIPTVVLMTESGNGKDIWTLPFDDINRDLFLFFISIPFFLLTLAAGKASILFMYLRIFVDQRFRRIVWATHIFNVCFFLAFLILNLAACRPLSFFWLGWDGEHNGHCAVGLVTSNYAQAGIGLCLDVWMLLLPVAPVWGLNMRWKRKLGVLLMFASGIFIVIASILRIVSIVAVGESQNLTANSHYLGLWAHWEMTVCIIVACMPNTGLFLRHFIVPHLRRKKSLAAAPGWQQHSKGHDASAASASGSLPAPSWGAPRPQSLQEDWIPLDDKGGRTGKDGSSDRTSVAATTGEVPASLVQTDSEERGRAGGLSSSSRTRPRMTPGSSIDGENTGTGGCDAGQSTTELVAAGDKN